MPWPRRRRRTHTLDEPAAAPQDGAGDAPSEGGAVPDSVVVFMHIPKCAGTSLHEWMHDVLAPGVLSDERLRLPREISAERSAELHRHRVFSGHFDTVDLGHFPSPQRRFTVFRDPVERIVSLYDFWRAFDPDFVDEHDLGEPRLARSMTFEEFVGDPHPSIVHAADMICRRCAHRRSV